MRRSSTLTRVSVVIATPIRRIRILLQLYRLTRVFSRHFSCLLSSFTNQYHKAWLGSSSSKGAFNALAPDVRVRSLSRPSARRPRRTVPTRRNTSTPRLARTTLRPRPRHAAARRPCVSGFRVPRSRDTRFGRERAPAVRRRRRARAPVAVPACNTLLIGFGPRFARGLVPIGIILDVAPVVTVQHSSKLGSLGSPGSRALLIHFLSLLLLCRGRGR